MSIHLDMDKLSHGLKNFIDKSNEENYTKSKRLRNILVMLEVDEVDYDDFNLKDVEELLDLYYYTEEPDIEKDLRDFAYLRDRIKNVIKKTRGGAKKYAFI